MMDGKRLHIVVPYRDRPQHLDLFGRAVRAYFARDKADRVIPYRVTVVEQAQGLAFNRGMLGNIGFMLGREASDYTCFHDVDYLPIWADYSWPDLPTALVWHGAESRPVALAAPERRIVHKLQNFYGGVQLVPNALFAGVNGFANSYWGWGYEDMDFRNRFAAAGIAFARRKGTFKALDHDSAGYLPDGAPTPAADANRKRFEARWQEGAPVAADGLSTLAFDIVNRRPLPAPEPEERHAPWEMVTVRLQKEQEISPGASRE